MKSLISASMVLAAVCCVQADVAALYWMVDQSQSPAIEYQYAKVQVVESESVDFSSYTLSDSAKYLNSYYDSGNVSILANGDGPTYADVSGYSTGTYSFFVELLNYNNGQWYSVGHTESYTYAQLLSSGYITTSGLSPHVATAAMGANVSYGVPEPTSGLLLVLGASLLALRRRRA